MDKLKLQCSKCLEFTWSIKKEDYQNVGITKCSNCGAYHEIVYNSDGYVVRYKYG